MDNNRIDRISVEATARHFSRRTLAQSGAGLAIGAFALGKIGRAAAAQNTFSAVTDELEAAIGTILADPRYRPSRFGLYVADLETGEAVFDIRGEQWFLAASTTKLFSGAAALDAYGPDHRFETPVYRTEPVGADGTLGGDLILVASGDLTMGGRDTEDGEIAFTGFDHIYAAGFPGLVVLTPQDPLAGLDDLAAQVAAAGIRRIDGEVIVDDRLFPSIEKTGYILTPIWINDNLIDLIVTPGAVGEAATLDWRPMSAAYLVESAVQTVAAGEVLDLSVSSPAPGYLLVVGQIPADAAQAVQIHQVEDPPAFVRTLLIEALERAGVTVAAAATGANPVERLPAAGNYAAADQVALHRSLPFAENIKLVEKVSHNQHADMLVFLLALTQGQTTYEEGMWALRAFLEEAELDPTLISLSTGRGNEYTNLISPLMVTRLLSYMATRPDAQYFYDALSIVGVDGTETVTVPPTSPVVGKSVAKSGMTVTGDLMNERPLMMTRGLAGYLTGQSGRELVFGLYLNNVPLTGLDDVATVITEHGAIVEAIFERA